MKITYSLHQVDDIAKQLVQHAAEKQVIAFTGSLGAGKTTLIKALMACLGVKDVVTSPTFAYVNTYQGSDRKTIYHFDLYRIPSLDDFIAAGFDEYLYELNSIAIVEWPEVIMPILQNNVLFCSIEYENEQQRTMYCSSRLE